MTSKFKLKWSLWIGVMAGIYVFLYSISPLAQYGVMPATFVALPIYFAAGAQKKDFFSFALSSAWGVLWGKGFLIVMGWLGAFITLPALSDAIVVCALTILCVIIHFFIPEKLFFCQVAACFGGIAVTLMQGGNNMIPLMITLALGVLLGLVCATGATFLTPEGKWASPAKVKAAQSE